MPKLEDARHLRRHAGAEILPVTVIVAARNEARNLPQCLESLRDAGQVYVIDSQSTDGTGEIAKSQGAQVVQFHYRGGWPKKRQWAMESLPLAYDWILLLDADESLTPELGAEIRQAIENPAIDGYYIALRMYFLGRLLRHGGAGFWKLSLFRRGKGGYECRLKNQDLSMADMEIHEHIVVAGATARLKNPLVHRNVESLSRYIQKHDEYSNWEANVWARGEDSGQLPPALFGTQAQRRRWLKKSFLRTPGAPFFFFLIKYLFGLGFLDGIPGLIYCGFQAIQLFHVKSKIYELRQAAKPRNQ
ncbi:MAG TPA: glycosyltransferase family 2 protein [Candidatus Sulfotelmatobacter sp.]|jgi:glycosyltransferase involved in cell wall biosynthesis